MAIRSRSFCEATDLKPNAWIVIRGVMATIATKPNASAKILASPCNTKQIPTAKGRIKVEVSGPLATPPESNAIAVYSFGTKKEC